ncbi:MAG: redoxin domain-containing protein, partial [Pararhodobacter sp.]
MLIPRQTAPALTVPTLDHGLFDLSAATPGRGTILCFYRGLLCPICATYLTELEKQTPAFAERGY